MSPHGVAATASISSPIEEEAIEHTIVPNYDSSVINTSSNKLEPVFALIQRIRKELQTLIDTPLNYEQFKTPAINFSVVRPLLLKLSSNSKGKQQPPAALIYALLINRVQFKNEAELDLAFVGVQTARADLCELLATKLLSAYSSSELLAVLTTNFNPFNAVTLDMFADHENMGEKELDELEVLGGKESSNALELAIFSKAKRFVKNPLTQQIIEAIYTGTIIYQPEGSHSLIRDDYKRKPVVEIYDWRNHSFLDHYRLRVPQIRNRMELVAFSGLIVLFLIAQATWNDGYINFWEGLFIFWSCGFALDEVASILENGLSAYLLGVYNVLDLLFCLIFFTFLSIRVSAVAASNTERSEFAFATLAMSATVLFPRLSISLIRGNVILLALSAMVKEFLFFMSLAALTASGFLIALHVIARGSWDYSRIAWLMFKIWLGNSYLGFDAASQFHPVYGPIIIVCFAVLSQTLLLTILISLLSNTFAQVQANAQTELLNQKALRTIERVKSDAMSSYTVPANLVAFIILLPLRNLSNPRWFHKINVFLIKLFNLPVLLLIALLTRAKHRNYGRSTSSTITLQTQRAWAALHSSVPWEGTVEGVGRIFERELTDKATLVESIDAPAEEEDTVADIPKESQRRASIVSASDSRSGAGGEGSTSSNQKSTLNRSRSSRMGSLGSPLAKIFTLHGQTIPESSSSSNISTPLGGALNHKELQERLENIEGMLKALLGEVAKSGKEKTSSSMPLRSMTGQQEESYDSESES